MQIGNGPGDEVTNCKLLHNYPILTVQCLTMRESLDTQTEIIILN